MAHAWIPSTRHPSIEVKVSLNYKVSLFQETKVKQRLHVDMSVLPSPPTFAVGRTKPILRPFCGGKYI